MFSAYAEKYGTSETMENPQEIRRSAAQRLRELFPHAASWEESAGPKVRGQQADLLVKFKLGGHDQTLLLEITKVGQPRQIRETITRLGELRAEVEGAYPVAVAQYISPQGAGLLKRNGLGYLDLSANCYIAFGNMLIEKEGKPNLRPSTRPLKALFAPRATRVVRTLLADPGHLWRLDELARASQVSLGHAHNVIKRLGDLAWVERGERQRIFLSKPADLLDAWVEAYTYRLNGIATYISGADHPKGRRGPRAGRRGSQSAGRVHAACGRRPRGPQRAISGHSLLHRGRSGADREGAGPPA